MPVDTAVIDAPTSTPETAEAAKTVVQHAFDIATASKQALKPKSEAEKPPEKPVEPAKPTEPTTAKPDEPSQPEDLKLPSFITEPNKVEAPKEPEIKLEDLPKEPPSTASENEKINWKKTRTLLEKQESEIKELRAKQSDPNKDLTAIENARLEQLENENKGMREQLQRLGLQQHPDFQQQIIQPLRATYAEAKRIIKDAGANPDQLDKALMLTGKAHYEAMDEILGELPESAKIELNSAIRDYRKLNQARANAVANAPKALEELTRQETIRTRQYLETQKEDMSKLFDARVKVLRDQFKFEPLMETSEEQAKWWNDIPKRVIETAKKIALENQDVELVMDASILAASAPTLRDLWLKSEDRAIKAEKELRELRGAEPRIGDSPTIPAVDKDTVKEPFEKLFLRTLKAASNK